MAEKGSNNTPSLGAKAREERQRLREEFMARFASKEVELKKWIHLCQYLAYRDPPAVGALDKKPTPMEECEKASVACFKPFHDIKAKVREETRLLDVAFRTCMSAGGPGAYTKCMDEYETGLKGKAGAVSKMYDEAIAGLKGQPRLAELYAKYV